MDEKGKRQNWKESLALGAQGVAEVSKFLESDLVKQTWFNTYLVHNVEQDQAYQNVDIDLLWVIPVGTFLRCHTIEVKSDRNRHTGNFFFETVSVEQRGKPGAFVITRAEWLFYYYILAAELYCFPMDKLKPWFLENEKSFLEKRAHSDDHERRTSWTTVGRVVPIKHVLAKISGHKIFKKAAGHWEAVSQTA